MSAALELLYDPVGVFPASKSVEMACRRSRFDDISSIFK